MLFFFFCLFCRNECAFSYLFHYLGMRWTSGLLSANFSLVWSIQLRLRTWSTSKEWTRKQWMSMVCHRKEETSRYIRVSFFHCFLLLCLIFRLVLILSEQKEFTIIYRVLFLFQIWQVLSQGEQQRGMFPNIYSFVSFSLVSDLSFRNRQFPLSTKSNCSAKRKWWSRRQISPCLPHWSQRWYLRCIYCSRYNGLNLFLFVFCVFSILSICIFCVFI
jgi:hypothetical protein